jgi:uncharacterized membrane protein
MSFGFLSTLIAKAISASTKHIITPFCLTHPKIALGTHLILLPFHEQFELQVILTLCIIDLVLFTTHVLMEDYSTGEAIMSLADLASEVISL